MRSQRLTTLAMTLLCMGWLMCGGCSWGLSERVAGMEALLRTVMADHQLFPRQLETMRIEVGTLEDEVKRREQRVLTELTQLRREDITFLIERLDALTTHFQDFRREMAAVSQAVPEMGAMSGPEPARWTALNDELDRMQQAVVQLARMVDVMQVQQDQHFSASTVWLSGLARQIYEGRKHR
jgi:hypothetical protein